MNQPKEQSPEALLQEALRLQAVATKLAKLVTAQQEAIQQSDLDTLEAILQQKQLFLEQLKAFPHIKQSFEEFPQTAASPISLGLSTAIKKIEESIGHISRAEEATILVAQGQYWNMARHLRELTQHRQATSSYSQANQTPHRGTIDISS